MIESQKTVMPVKYKFFARIFIATFLGWAVPHIAYRLLQPQILTFTFTITLLTLNYLILFGFVTALISGALIGFWVSFAQWIALRPYIRYAWLWFLGIIAVWSLGDGMVSILDSTRILAFHLDYSAQALLVLYVVDAFVVGCIVGIIQQTLLQKRTGIRIWWALGGFLGIFSTMTMDAFNGHFHPHYLMYDPIYAAIVEGLVFAVFASLPALLLKPLETSEPKVLSNNTEASALPQ